MSKMHKKVCRVLNYIEHLLILIPTVSACTSCSSDMMLQVWPISHANNAAN